ncbi:MAG: DUF1501 domain-containing protein [Xenococcus sp. (in: cyanobacteria)]
MKRRKFLEHLALATGGMLIPVGRQTWVARSANQVNNPQRLVVILLRGGIDGLNVVVPHQEPNYYDLRPAIAIPYPGEPQGVIDLDGFFGLHPALSDLVPLWKRKNIAFVCNSGSPDNTRSHFDAQDYIESGTPGRKSTSDGWMNRLLANLPADRITQALNVGITTPKILQGTMAVANLRPGKNSLHKLPIDRPAINQAFARLYNDDSELAQAYRKGIEAREIIMAELQPEMNSASGNANSVNGFVDDAKEVGKLIRSDARTQLAFMNIAGWDTHMGEKNILQHSLPHLGKGLATLIKELGHIYSNTAIIAISEFGRTVKENGNQGTDHGHGNVMWLLGGGIRGGQIYGKWEGLEDSTLYEGRDLPVTTDFREVISSILVNHMAISQSKLGNIFPGYQFQNSLNFIK